jgi:hypothetical protein
MTTPFPRPISSALTPSAAAPTHPGVCRFCKFWIEALDDVWLAYANNSQKVICVRCFWRIAYGSEPPDEGRHDA